MRMTSFSAHIDQVDVSYYKIPTDLESDGTLDWDHTNLTIVTVRAGNEQDLGYTYGGSEVAAVIHGVLADKTTCHRKACIGEYGYTPFYFREMLEDRCVDVPQADITRCGYCASAGVCGVRSVQLSAFRTHGSDIELELKRADAQHFAA